MADGELEGRNPESLDEELERELPDSRRSRVVVEGAVAKESHFARLIEAAALRNVQISVSHEESLRLGLAERSLGRTGLGAVEVEVGLTAEDLLHVQGAREGDRTDGR